MKILQVAHSFPPYDVAGAEVYTYNLSRELARKYRAYVFHRICDLNKKEYAVGHNSLEGLEIFALNNAFRRYNSFEQTYKNNVIAEKFAAVLEEVKPDIVHIQHLLYLGAKIIEEIKKRDIPVVFTLHDYWLICPQGQLLRNNLSVCDGRDLEKCWDCVLYQLSVRKNTFNFYYTLQKIIPRPLFQCIKSTYFNCAKALMLKKEEAVRAIEERRNYILNYICPKIDLFISPSNFLREKFVDFGIPQSKIISCRYGIKLDNFKSSKIASRKLRFAFIGNILPAKGIHILIKAFNKIKEDNAVLEIYGRVVSYKGILADYLNYIKKIARSKNIKFIGGFDNKDAGKIFAQIDVLVVPSIWYENSPLVIQEAFAAKTSVIASRIGGIPELIQDGTNGILVEPDDVDDLFRKISSIIREPYFLEDIKQNIKPPKTIEQNAQETENLYEELLCGSVLT